MMDKMNLKIFLSIMLLAILTQGVYSDNCAGNCNITNASGLDAYAEVNVTIVCNTVEIPNNTIDDNCNGAVDETYCIRYRDADGDGYGSRNNTTMLCNVTVPAGYVNVSGDCNNNNATIHPEATDVCGNGIDENCDGSDAVCPTYYSGGSSSSSSSSSSGGTKNAGIPINSTVCGDGKCERLETYESCFKDCPKPIICGDSTCEGNETNITCPKDCLKPVVCSDGVCEGNETNVTCLKDCQKPVVCGDGVCEGNETNATCQGDCPKPIICGDGVCESNETNITCPKDCQKPVVCGDGVCEGNETNATCPGDHQATGCWLINISLLGICWYWWILALFILLILILILLIRKRKVERERIAGQGQGGLSGLIEESQEGRLRG